ncbi:MAG TPA: hypothetical protein VHD85_16150 [Terracidiphilus sp.]|nr:hypothetical protein [Terracidiphilus sp.]
MKFLSVALLLAAPLCAQNTASNRNGQPNAKLPVTCGSEATHFGVKPDTGQHAIAPPEPGKARVYFIFDSGTVQGAWLVLPVTKFAIDGAWVGAARGDSWFSVSVEPGEHRFCMALQSSFYSPRPEFVHLNADAGKVYYYRARIVISERILFLDLNPVDSDEGEYLIASFPMSVSTAKK